MGMSGWLTEWVGGVWMGVGGLLDGLTVYGWVMC